MQTGESKPMAEPLEEARRLRAAFATRYGVLSMDLVQVAREERESNMTSVLVAQDQDESRIARSCLVRTHLHWGSHHVGLPHFGVEILGKFHIITGKDL